MGHGSRHWKPALVTLCENRPKVVTTATSVWRTWKVNNMQRKISSSTPLVTNVILFCFIGSESSVRRGFVHVRRRNDAIEEVTADVFLQIQSQHVLRVGRREDILAGRRERTGERFEIGPGGVNRRRRLVGRHLIGKSRGLPFGQRDLAHGHVARVRDNSGGLRFRGRNGPRRVRLPEEDICLLLLLRAEDLLESGRHLDLLVADWWMNA